MSELGITDIWGLVRPRFDLLFTGDIHSVTAWLVLIIWAVAAVTFALLLKRALPARSQIANARGLLADVSPESLATRRQEILRKAEGLDPGSARDAWREFDESLVASPDGKNLWNTVEAEQIFSAERFAPRLVNNRLLAAMPTVLTTLGLLGTFLGLATGLMDLDLGPDASVEDLQRGIQTVVSGAAMGFTASLWGVFMSLVVNLVEKFVERLVVDDARSLQSRVDELFTLHSPEQSLVSIEVSTEESRVALAELHEKIGQEISGLAGDMRSAVEEALVASIAPKMHEIAQTAASSSHDVFAGLVGKFAEAFEGIGTSLADELKKSSDDLRSTLEYMSDKLAEQADEHRRQLAALQELTARQVAMLDTSLPRVITGLETAAASVGAATTLLGPAAENLRQTSTHFESTAAQFREALADSVDSFEELRAQQAGLGNTVERLANQMVEVTESSAGRLESLTTTAVTAAGLLEQSATTLSDGFSGLREHQDRYLADLDARMQAQLGTVSTWLTDYSDQVQKQTERRLDEWNRHTESYTDTMLTAVQALSAAVDDLEAQTAGVRTPDAA